MVEGRPTGQEGDERGALWNQSRTHALFPSVQRQQAILADGRAAGHSCGAAQLSSPMSPI